MTHYRYKNRKQPENRRHLGELETNKECKERLKIIKKENENLEKLKKEMNAQTGTEFYFGMHKKELKHKNYEKEQQYIEWEIRRIKKKLNEKSKGIHIKFENDRETQGNVESKAESETTMKLKEYLDELRNVKKKYKHTK